MYSKEKKPFGWWFNQWKIGADNDELRFGDTEQMFFDGNNGFVCFDFTQDGKVMFITKSCGNMLFWRKKLQEVFAEAMKAIGTEAVVMHIKKRPMAICRVINGHVYKTSECKDGSKKYWVVSTDPLGNKNNTGDD